MFRHSVIIFSTSCILYLKHVTGYVTLSARNKKEKNVLCVQQNPRHDDFSFLPTLKVDSSYMPILTSRPTPVSDEALSEVVQTHTMVKHNLSF
jgi:hypothetical protein